MASKEQSESTHPPGAARNAAGPWERAARYLAWGAAGAGLAVLFSYLRLLVLHLTYPFALERMEGGGCDQAYRLAHGLPAYPAPGLDFIPYLYTPLYYYLAALPVRLLGPGFAGPRLVSVGGWAVVGLLLTRAWRKQGAGGALTIALLGVFGGAGQVVDAAWSLARVDSVAMALTLGGAHLLIHRESRASAAAAALLLTAAVFTKQNSIFAAGLAALFLLVRQRGRLVSFVAAGAVAGGLAFAWLQVGSGGWFYRYTVLLPRHLAIDRRMVWAFFIEDLSQLWPLLLLAVILVARDWGAVREKKQGLILPWDWFLLAGLLQSWTIRWVSGGGSRNNLIPAVTALILFTGVMAARTGRASAGRTWSGLIVPVLLLVQLFVLGWDWGPWTPLPGSRAVGERLIERLRSVPGEVLIPSHPHYAVMSGKPMTFDLIALAYVTQGRELIGGQDGRDQIVAALDHKRYAVIILDSSRPRIEAFESALRRNYRLAETLFSPADPRFYTLCGVHVRPDQWWVPQAPGPPGP